MRLKATLLALVSLTAFVVNRPALAQQTSNKAVSEALCAARKYAEADNLKTTIEYCDKALALESKCSEAYSLRGWAREYTGDFNGAQCDYEKLVRLDKKNIEGYLGRASVKMRLHQIDQAHKDLNTALKLAPNNDKVHLELSRYWSKAANNKSAIAEATMAISLNKTNPFSYYQRAFCQFEDWKYRAAVSDMDLAIKYEPNDSMYYRTRASFKSLLGDTAGAIRDCSTAIKINPQDAIAYGQRGDLLIQSKDQTAAIKDFEAGLRVAPHDIGCNFNLACEMLKSGHFAEALSKFDVVTRLRPSKETYILRGDCKMELQQYSEAIADFSAALALDNSDALSYFLRAQCRAHSGDIIGAASDFTISTINNPSLSVKRLSACLQRFW